MPTHVPLDRFVAGFAASPLAPWAGLEPWQLTAQAQAIVRSLLGGLDRSAYAIEGEVATHRSALVEAGAILKGPLVVGPHCFIASGAYLRAGNWLDAHCSLGPSVELKSSFLFEGTKLAHFNFVGDSILGADVNLEAGSIVCNHRNEREDKDIRIRLDGSLHATGSHKFGAVIGDHGRVGANAVLAPGTLLPPRSVIQRASLTDPELPDSTGTAR